MLEFELMVVINRPVEEVFAFFKDIDQHAGQKGTVVPIYDKLTPGPVGVGTRYREIVVLLPFLTGEIQTEVTAYEPGKKLGYQFVAMGMPGELTYLFEPTAAGVKLVQRQSLSPKGWMKPFSPVIKAMFFRKIVKRLTGIKRLLEEPHSQR